MHSVFSNFDRSRKQNSGVTWNEHILRTENINEMESSAKMCPIAAIAACLCETQCEYHFVLPFIWMWMISCWLLVKQVTLSPPTHSCVLPFDFNNMMCYFHSNSAIEETRIYPSIIITLIVIIYVSFEINTDEPTKYHFMHSLTCKFII